MKRFFAPIALAVMVTPFVCAQQASNQISIADNAAERTNVLRSSLALHDSQEKVFWPLFEQYEVRLNELKANSFKSLREVMNHAEADAARLSVRNLFDDQREEAALKKEYFEKVVATTNGTVALQFLQGEALYDLLMRSRLYEQMSWTLPAWTTEILEDEKMKEFVVEEALEILPADSADFRRMMADFEFEYARVVGHQFAFFEQYIDNAGEWTPGQCRKLGQAFIGMQSNEVKVKDRFFTRFDHRFGAGVAARFIALQEYLNMMSKLKVWSDYITPASVTQR